MSDRFTFRLPRREQMLDRLMDVSGESHFMPFYRILLEHAGEETEPQTVVMMLSMAMNRYAEQSGPAMAGTIAKLLGGYTERFIDALIVDSAPATTAKAFLNQALSEPE